MVKKTKKKGARTNLANVRKIFAGLDEGNKFWKPKVGENIIRILPSNREDGNFAFKSVMHHGFKVEGSARAFPCLAYMGKSCPVCQVLSYFDTDTDPDVQDLMKNIGPRESYLMNILVKGEDKPKIYSAAKTVMRDFMSYMNDEEYGDITDPEEGRYIKLKRTGEGLGTKYSTRVSPSTSAIEGEDWEENLFNLEKEAFREIPSYKRYVAYLQSNFGGVLDIDGALSLDEKEDEKEEKEEEEEGDSTLMKFRKKKKLKLIKKVKTKPVKEEEDTDEEESDDDLEDL